MELVLGTLAPLLISAVALALGVWNRLETRADRKRVLSERGSARKAEIVPVGWNNGVVLHNIGLGEAVSTEILLLFEAHDLRLGRLSDEMSPGERATAFRGLVWANVDEDAYPDAPHDLVHDESVAVKLSWVSEDGTRGEGSWRVLDYPPDSRRLDDSPVRRL